MIRRLHRLPALLFTVLLWIAAAPASLADAETDATFHKDILPVFQRYCIDCHRVGGRAPQSLETYKLSYSWLRESRRLMNTGVMPPWHADPEVGTWKNATLPTKAEIQLVSDWVKARAPEGDPIDAPTPLDFSAPWELGDPDLVLEAPEEVTIPADGSDIYRTFVLNPGFEAETWLEGIELKPGDPQSVVDMSVSIISAESAKVIAPDAFDSGPWGPGSVDDIVVWNKGMTLTERFPEGTGVRVSAGGKIVLQIHYRPAETAKEASTDRSSLALFFSEVPPATALASFKVERRDFSIKSQSYDYRLRARTTLERPSRIYSLLPRMHYLALGAEVRATLPDGEPRSLLKIQDFDYKLQARYTPATPIDLPAGTILEFTAVYENTIDNPNNPNPEVRPMGYGPAPQGERFSLVLICSEEDQIPR